VLDVAANYDDNVYRTQTGTKNDWYFSESPGFRLESDWVRHELDVYGMVNTYQYATLNREDHTDLIVGADGRLDIHTGIDFTGGGAYSVLHEARTSPDQPGVAKRPTQFSYSTAHGLLEYHPYHFGFAIGGNFARYDYNTTQFLPSSSLSNTDRDRNEFETFAKVSYEFSPGYAVFVRADDRQMTYDLSVDRNGLRRSNHGYSVNGGLDMLVTNLIKGEVFAGYLDEHYQAPLTNVSGFNFGANLVWDPSVFWTVRLTASRTLNGTTLNNASAEDDQVVRLEVDYSPTPTITVEPHLGYTDSSFSGISRRDQYVDTGLSVSYAINRLFSARLGYDYQDRSTNAAGQKFTDNTVTIGLTAHL
jgi:hypothetical protein